MSTEALTIFRQTIVVLTEEIKALEIVDEATKSRANFLLVKDKQAQAQVCEVFDPIIASADKAHKQALDKKKEFFQPLKSIEDLLKRKLSAYILAQERKRQEAEEKARREAEEARKANEELIRKAAEMEKAGEEVDVEQLFSQVKEVPEPLAETKKPYLSGASVRTEWNYRIVDIELIPREYWILDEQKLRRTVRVMKELTNIPGIEAFELKLIAAKTRF